MPAPAAVNDAFRTALRVQYSHDSLQIVMHRHIFSPTHFMDILKHCVVHYADLAHLEAALQTPPPFSVPIPRSFYRDALQWIVENHLSVRLGQNIAHEYHHMLGTFAAVRTLLRGL